MPAKDIVIAGAARTAVGAFNGAFATVPAHVLGQTAIVEALKRASVGAEEVDEVILGQILSAGQGQNPARQAAIGAGLPKETTAWGVNQLCGSGLRAVALGMQQIASGDADDHRRRRSGVDVDGAALRAPARRREDGRLPDGRHHDQGRPVGCLQRLPHGGDGRERRARVPDRARHAGRIRRRLAEQGRGGPEIRPLQGRNRAGDDQDPQGRRGGRSG